MAASQLSTPFVFSSAKNTYEDCMTEARDLLLGLGSPLTSLDDDNLRALLAEPLVDYPQYSEHPTTQALDCTEVAGANYAQEVEQVEHADIDLEPVFDSVERYRRDYDVGGSPPAHMTGEEEEEVEEETLAEGQAVSYSVPASPFYSAQASPLSSAPPSPWSSTTSPYSSPPQQPTSPPPQLEVSLKEKKKKKKKVDHRFYYFSSMPEKNKIIWSTLYSSILYTLDNFRLVLDGDEGTLELEATKASWMAVDQDAALKYQYKVAFSCPNSTYNRCVFNARLLHDNLDVALGPLSIVSTTSQRQAFFEALKARCETNAQERLIINFQKHSPNKRHHSRAAVVASCTSTTSTTSPSPCEAEPVHMAPSILILYPLLLYILYSTTKK